MSHNPNFSDDELEYIEPENLDTQRSFRQPTNAANSAQEPDALDDAPLDDGPATAATRAERTVLSQLEAGCTAPVAATSHWEGEQLVVRGGVFALDGSRQLIAQAQGAASEAEELGRAVSKELFAQGAADVLAAE